MKTYALAGNPNVGKTALFNELTGANQHVGNWPGVTVEKKEGRLHAKYGDARIIDLPGIYSLSPYSLEERITRAFIVDERPDVVINLVEATNIERNLYLTCQIAELGVPMVVAVNMMDEARAAGDEIDIDGLSKALGLPVMPIVAIKGEGVIELLETAGAASLMREVDREADHPFHDGEDEHGHGFHDTEDPDEHIRDHHTDSKGRTNALVSEFKYHNHYKGPKVYQPTADAPLTEEQEKNNADRRYSFIKKVVDANVKKGHREDEATKSDRADRIITHPILGLLIFIAIMWFMFHLTFSEDFLYLGALGLLEEGIPGPGVWLQGIMEALIGWLQAVVSPAFVEGSWAQSLVIDGIFGGVGAVLSFLPQILVMFLCLTILEDVGYMARAAFMMDRLLRTFGLTGKSFVPMLMGFGCGVPAMMACRTMETETDRKITLFLVPFMSCGARAPIYLVFCGAFFPSNADVVVLCLYFGGIVAAIFTGWLLKKLVFKGETTPMLIELPKYRAPRPRSVGLALWKQMKDYVSRAGTIIFVVSVAVWFLSSFGFAGGSFGAVDIDSSLLAVAGSFIAPVFKPLGFGFWAAGVALLTGFAAKEAVVGTLGVLTNVGEDAAIEGGALDFGVLSALGFTTASSLAFMVFVLLYLPCLAAFATLKRESNSWGWTLMQAVYSCLLAWVCAFAVYHVALACGL